MSAHWSSASYLEMLPSVKHTIRNSFEKMGLEATVSQAPKGGFAFVVDFSARGELKLPNNSTLLEKMAGAWVKSQAQVSLSTRPEPNTPGGYIDVANIYIVQSRFLMSPSNYKPKPTDVFLVAEKVDPALDSNTLDYNLLSVITENLAVSLDGGILYGDTP